MNKTLVIIGHPNPDSYGAALAQRYVQGAKQQGAEVKVLNLAHLNFDPNLHTGFGGEQPLEPDLLHAQELLTWCDHICIVTPTWWSSMPAILKGFIDRVFLPGFAFQYRKGSPFPQQLLKGRTARLILTTDSPPFLLKYVMGDSTARILGRGVLSFCGVRPVRVGRFGPVRGSSAEQREKWLEQIFNLAQQDHAKQAQFAKAKKSARGGSWLKV